MDKDDVIDAIQDNTSKASKVLPRQMQTAVKTAHLIVDIEQESASPTAPAKWKVSIAETGKMLAQSYVGVPLSIAVTKISLIIGGTAGPQAGFIVFYNGMKAIDSTLDYVGEHTNEAIMELLNTRIAEQRALQFGDFLLDARNSIEDAFESSPHAPYSSAIDPLSNDAQYTLPEDGAPSVFPQSHLSRQFTPLSSTSSAVVNEGGFFSSVGSFFSGIGSGIADFFGRSSDVGSTSIKSSVMPLLKMLTH